VGAQLKRAIEFPESPPNFISYTYYSSLLVSDHLCAAYEIFDLEARPRKGRCNRVHSELLMDVFDEPKRIISHQ